MEKVLPARNGLPTALYRGCYLHSSYDPEKEALRFSASSGRFSEGPVVVLIGEALGYLSRQLRRDNPGIRLLPVYCSAYFYRKRIEDAGEEGCSWRPGTSESFSAFLHRHIREMDFPALRVLEWEPAARAFPLLIGGLKEDLSRFSRQVNGSLLTTAVFGKKWITNSIRNYLAIDGAVSFTEISGPVFIAASGPGLAAAFPFIERERRAFTLFALPSAAAFLLRRGVEPDGLMMTDPGFYTGLHFGGLIRREKRGGGELLCMPLPAYSGFHGGGFPVCLFHQGTPPENALLGDLSPRPVRIPSNGTVAGTAVQAALSLGAGPVILAGMDMAVRGIEEHVRPNAFDEYYTVRDCRFGTEESGRAGRIFTMYPDRLSGGWRTSPALRTYAGWFASAAASWKGRVVSISDSPVDTGLHSTCAGARKLLGQRPRLVCERLPLPGPRQRREKARAFIKTIENVSWQNTGLLMMIDTAGVLEVRKKTAGAEEKLRRGIAEFSASLYSLLKASE
ncbi:MAG: DUF115 domain-containing protein [Spirochaetales bacterium]|jgi:hypothetical protein|nr:DUF115 domain-containing protein [Spirochaetales bacterium]